MSPVAKASLILFLIHPLALEARSFIGGIYTAGVSADSTVYTITRQEKQYADLTTDSSLSAKLGSIFYFPKKKLELSPYYKLRHQEYHEAKKSEAYQQLEEKQNLSSLGLEGRGQIFHSMEWQGDFELRQELGFQVDDSTQTIIGHEYLNLKLSGGARYNLYQANRTELGLQGKIATLIPFNQEFKLGHLGELALVGFQKMGRKHSLQTELFYEYYKQNSETLSVERQELGLRLSYVFRM